MSNLDLIQQEAISLKADQIQQNLPNVHDTSMDQVDEDLLEVWREVFKEDKVQVLEVCC